MAESQPRALGGQLIWRKASPRPQKHFQRNQISYATSRFPDDQYFIRFYFLSHFLLNFINTLLVFIFCFTTIPYRYFACFNFLYYFLLDFTNPLFALISYIIFYQILLVFYQSLSLIIFFIIFYQSYINFYYTLKYLLALLAFN